MALAGRSARRGGTGVRWLAIGVVITLLVLLVDASLHSRSVTEGEGLVAGTWIDRVLPIVAVSTEEGQQLAQFWANGLHLSGSIIASELQQLTSGSATAYQDLVKLRPPINLAGASGLLEACLLGETGSGEGTTLDTAEELETEEFVEVIEVHGVRLSPGGTISFDKTKIRRKLCLQQHILFVNYSFRVIYGTELPEERLLLTQSLSKAITLKLSILGIR